ncbi:MAG TPA: hypothetical protein VIJ72_00245 [Rhizomicrobium sp.]
MQHAQQNYKLTWTAFALVFAMLPAAAGSISHPSAPDPILSGGVPGPCDPKTAGADLVSGTDVTGNPVVPADVSTITPPMPKAMLVPLGHGRGEIELSQAQLAALTARHDCPKRGN